MLSGQTAPPSMAVAAQEWDLCSWFPGHRSAFSPQLHSVLVPAMKSQRGWRYCFLLIHHDLFLSPSTGHPVPKPELTHLLEHGQELWTGKRGLSRSTCSGRRGQLVRWSRGSLQHARNECL